jgi:hypothetical protein
MMQAGSDADLGDAYWDAFRPFPKAGKHVNQHAFAPITVDQKGYNPP